MSIKGYLHFNVIASIENSQLSTDKICEVVRNHDVVFPYSPAHIQEIEVEHHISWYHWGKSFYFVTRLPVTPNVGVSFDLGFFRPVDTTRYYYVYRVSHMLEEEKQIIHITLRTGFHNTFTIFREDQEEAETHNKGHWVWKEWMEKNREL